VPSAGVGNGKGKKRKNESDDEESVNDGSESKSSQLSALNCPKNSGSTVRKELCLRSSTVSAPISPMNSGRTAFFAPFSEKSNMKRTAPQPKKRGRCYFFRWPHKQRQRPVALLQMPLLHLVPLLRLRGFRMFLWQRPVALL